LISSGSDSWRDSAIRTGRTNRTEGQYVELMKAILAYLSAAKTFLHIKKRLISMISLFYVILYSMEKWLLNKRSKTL
jgi:hypothetical protein